MEVKLNIPDTFTIKVGGEEMTFEAAKVPVETFQVIFNHGWRKANDAYSSTKAQAKKAEQDAGRPWSDEKWTAKDHEETLKAIKERIESGDWERAAGAPSDPIGDLAKSLAKDALLTAFAKAAGAYDPKRKLPRARRVFDVLKGDAKAKMRKYGEPDGERSWTWSRDAIDRLVEAQGFRAKAEEEMRRREEEAEDVDLSAF